MATPKNQHTTHDEDWNRPPTQYLLQGTRGANETQSAETSSGLEEHPDVVGPKWLDGRERDETAGEELQRGKRDQYQQSEETTPGGDEQREMAFRFGVSCFDVGPPRAGHSWPVNS